MDMDEMLKQERASAIADGKDPSEYRADGYRNMLNKYGTKQDNSTAYEYVPEGYPDSMTLVHLYEGNGLFAKIIDRPAEEAVKHGLDIDFGSDEVAEYVEQCLDDLDWEEKFATAEKWARLYGGSIIVMLINDGRGLDEPLDADNAKSIEELRVFESAIVQPDYSALYNIGGKADAKQPFGEPEFYDVFSVYGTFRVHRSRCLVFRNGKTPEQTSFAEYRFWGIPEYTRIKRALRECVTSHGHGVKLLERSTQPIYRMKNLSNILSTAEGEEKVLQRMQVLDMARGILNSIAIDNDGEDYNFITATLSGVSDIINTTCNMLSAVTDIPQTILFGRSPAGENATGDSDFENFYGLVEGIQKQNMKRATRIIIDLILRQGLLSGKISKVHRYKVAFAPLFAETKQDKIAYTQSETDIKSAEVANVATMIEANVISADEGRAILAAKYGFSTKRDKPAEQPAAGGEMSPGQSPGQDEEKPDKKDESKPDDKLDANAYAEALSKSIDRTDGDSNRGAAVIVMKRGRFLVGKRTDNNQICGAGGHVETGEDPLHAAIRETKEEFGIDVKDLVPIGELKSQKGKYLKSFIYLANGYDGTPHNEDGEMYDIKWLTLKDLKNRDLFPAFRDSLDLLNAYKNK